MSRIKYQNPLYSGGIPLAVGDRYYAQDLGRDFNASRDFMSTMMRAITNLTPQLLRGGICSKGTNFNDMNITASFGVVGHAVNTPNDFSSLPPTVQSENILALIVEGAAQINLDLSATGTLDGVTVNYVKLRYKEIDGGTRNRAKKAGSYVYEKEPSFEIIVNSTAPTIYDCLLCSFVGNGSSVLTITQEPPYFEYQVSVSSNATIETGNSREIKVNSDTSGGNRTITLKNGSEDGQRYEVVSDGSGLTYLKGTGIYLGASSLGTPISDGLKSSGKWNAFLGKWIPDNEVTAELISGGQNIRQSSDGSMDNNDNVSVATYLNYIYATAFSNADKISFNIIDGVSGLAYYQIVSSFLNTSAGLNVLDSVGIGTTRICSISIKGKY